MWLIGKQIEINRKCFIIWRLANFLLELYVWVPVPLQDCVKIQKIIQHWKRVELSKGKLFLFFFLTNREVDIFNEL